MTNDPSIITVRLPDHSYNITAAPGLLARAGESIASISKSRRAFIVTDRTVGPFHSPALLNSLSAVGFETDVLELPPGESHKTLATVSTIYDHLLGHRVERSSIVFGLGGGVIGDMTGFAAATVLRGVPFVQVPTTLLAMVDASVGGKTGVNHADGKNLIGSFHQPISVLMDPETLRTLPPHVFTEGLAECIKHEIIRDAAGFDDLEKNIGRARALDIEYLTTLIAHNVSIKAKVVERDPMEHGERAHLNFGHTFGHAIEKVSRFSVPHGNAVALGMSAAIDVARSIGLISEAQQRRVAKLICAAGLPIRGLSGMSTDALVSAMRSDKKVEGGRIRLVLPNGIGSAVVRDDVSLPMITQAIESLRE